METVGPPTVSVGTIPLQAEARSVFMSVVQLASSGQTHRRQRRGTFRREGSLHLFLLPAVVITLVFSYGPMVGLVMAFQRYVPARGFLGSSWVGMENFRYVFNLPDFFTAFRNTLFISGMKIVAGLVVPVFVALLLNEIRTRSVRRSIQTLIYLPHFLSWVVLAGIFLDLLSPSTGIVNQVLSGVFGIEPIFFLGDKRWFPFVMVITDTWKGFGFGTIVYLAAITSINPNLYEAAIIDGANRFQQALFITLPGMKPIIILLLTLSLGSVLSAGFDQIFNLYSPSTYETGDIIDTLVYRIGLQQAQFSVGAAIGFFRSIISLVLISSSYYLAYRFANYRIF